MYSFTSLLVGGTLTIALTAVGISEMENAISDPFENMTISEFNHMLGVSDIVYDCVVDVLKDDGVENIISFIELEAPTAGTPGETVKAAAIKQCVYQDPFGWHGTENEWAIELLQTDTWD